MSCDDYCYDFSISDDLAIQAIPCYSMQYSSSEKLSATLLTLKAANTGRAGSSRDF
jgi:hypothetical protein